MTYTRGVRRPPARPGRPGPRRRRPALAGLRRRLGRASRATRPSPATPPPGLRTAQPGPLPRPALRDRPGHRVPGRRAGCAAWPPTSRRPWPWRPTSATRAPSATRSRWTPATGPPTWPTGCSTRRAPTTTPATASSSPPPWPSWPASSTCPAGWSWGSPRDGCATDGRVVVSDRNAHAWVELWMPTQGWVRFDPTPRGDGVNPATSDGLPFDVAAYLDIEVTTPTLPPGPNPSDLPAHRRRRDPHSPSAPPATPAAAGRCPTSRSGW